MGSLSAADEADLAELNASLTDLLSSGQVANPWLFAWTERPVSGTGMDIPSFEFARTQAERDALQSRVDEWIMQRRIAHTAFADGSHRGLFDALAVLHANGDFTGALHVQLDELRTQPFDRIEPHRPGSVRLHVVCGDGSHVTLRSPAAFQTRVLDMAGATLVYAVDRAELAAVARDCDGGDDHGLPLDVLLRDVHARFDARASCSRGWPGWVRAACATLPFAAD